MAGLHLPCRLFAGPLAGTSARLGARWFARPSPWKTSTSYSLPVSRRTTVGEVGGTPLRACRGGASQARGRRPRAARLPFSRATSPTVSRGFWDRATIVALCLIDLRSAEEQPFGRHRPHLGNVGSWLPSAGSICPLIIDRRFWSNTLTTCSARLGAKRSPPIWAGRNKRATLRQRGLSDETISVVLDRHDKSEYFWRELLCILHKLGDVRIDFDVTISDRPRSTASET